MKNRKVVNPLVRYRWFVAEGGYEWISVKVPPPRLIEGGKRVRLKPENDCLLVELDRSKWADDGLTRRTYEAPADLFDVFAKTQGTKEGIKAFADEFGQLGFERGKGTVLFPDDAVSGIDWHGEYLSSWRAAIAAIRNAIALWQVIVAARNRDESALSRYVKWDLARDFVTVFREPQPRAVPGVGDFRSWFGRDARPASRAFTRGALIRPAEEFLRQELMSRLTGSLSIGLDWNAVDWTAANSKSKLVRSFRPNSLLALMWLQFADALTGVTEFRPCKRKGCGNLIRISPEYGSHTNKQTCSDSCKVRVYQERVRTVIASFDEGKPPEEVATGFKTELSKVRRWIARELCKRGETVAVVSGRLFMKPNEVRKLLQVKKAARQ